MKRYLKIIILVGLVLLCSYFILKFYEAKEFHGWNSFEAHYARMLVVFSFSALFISLMFLINLHTYRRIWSLILISAILGWVLIYSFQQVEIPIESDLFWKFWEILIFFTYSIIGPGLILYIIHYIEKKTEKFEEAKLFGVYHVHEGFVGIIFLILAILLLPLRDYMNGEEIFHDELIFLLGTIQIFIFASFFIGSFLMFRDWRDVLHLKFLEKKPSLENKNPRDNSTIFLTITQEDLPFFKFFKLIIYPFGIILTNISINAIVYGSSFLPFEIFGLSYQEVVIFGFYFSLIAGGLIGLDWFRVFKRFSPEEYEELEQIIHNLKNS